MRRSRALALIILPLLWSFSLQAAADLRSSVIHVMTEQVAAWNRGDLVAFAASYADRCTLVGKTISAVRRQDVLQHYREKYPSTAAMGHLDFVDLQVQALGQRYAMATGKWHLERTEAGGGPVEGVFSLVLALENGEWHIVLDHTS